MVLADISNRRSASIDTLDKLSASSPKTVSKSELIADVHFYDCLSVEDAPPLVPDFREVFDCAASSANAWTCRLCKHRNVTNVKDHLPKHQRRMNRGLYFISLQYHDGMYTVVPYQATCCKLFSTPLNLFTGLPTRTYASQLYRDNTMSELLDDSQVSEEDDTLRVGNGLDLETPIQKQTRTLSPISLSEIRNMKELEEFSPDNESRDIKNVDDSGMGIEHATAEVNETVVSFAEKALDNQSRDIKNVDDSGSYTEHVTAEIHETVVSFAEKALDDESRDNENVDDSIMGTEHSTTKIKETVVSFAEIAIGNESHDIENVDDSSMSTEHVTAEINETVNSFAEKAIDNESHDIKNVAAIKETVVSLQKAENFCSQETGVLSNTTDPIKTENSANVITSEEEVASIESYIHSMDAAEASAKDSKLAISEKTDASDLNTRAFHETNTINSIAMEPKMIDIEFHHSQDRNIPEEISATENCRVGKNAECEIIPNHLELYSSGNDLSGELSPSGNSVSPKYPVIDAQQDIQQEEYEKTTCLEVSNEEMLDLDNDSLEVAKDSDDHDRTTSANNSTVETRCLAVSVTHFEGDVQDQQAVAIDQKLVSTEEIHHNTAPKSHKQSLKRILAKEKIALMSNRDVRFTFVQPNTRDDHWTCILCGISSLSVFSVAEHCRGKNHSLKCDTMFSDLVESKMIRLVTHSADLTEPKRPSYADVVKKIQLIRGSTNPNRSECSIYDDSFLEIHNAENRSQLFGRNTLKVKNFTLGPNELINVTSPVPVSKESIATDLDEEEKVLLCELLLVPTPLTYAEALSKRRIRTRNKESLQFPETPFNSPIAASTMNVTPSLQDGMSEATSKSNHDEALSIDVLQSELGDKLLNMDDSWRLEDQENDVMSHELTIEIQTARNCIAALASFDLLTPKFDNGTMH